MPTIILLDVSLSMCRSVRNAAAVSAPPTGKAGASGDDRIEVKQLANVGIGALLDYFAQNAQLEHTALIVFSSLWEIKHQFTRHHESIKNKIYDLELYDKSNILNALGGVLSMKLGDWAHNGPINIVLITDGQLYVPVDPDPEPDADAGQPGVEQPAPDADEPKQARLAPSAANSGTPSKKGVANADDQFHDLPLSELEGQFDDLDCKLQIVCLATQREPALKHSLPYYKKIVATVDPSVAPECPVIIGSKVKNFKQSAIWMPESEGNAISIESVERLFTTMAEYHHKPYHANLLCGNLSSVVMLSPKPQKCRLEPLRDSEHEKDSKAATSSSRIFELSDDIRVSGFMSLVDIASPAVVSRHYVFPIPSSRTDEISKVEQILSRDPVAVTGKPDKVPQIQEPTVDAGRASTEPAGGHSEQDITKQPSFCVLLHNGLKRENMVAICVIGKEQNSKEEWFGMLHTSTDNKKRTSLMLSLLIPGTNPVLWLPSFKSMTTQALQAELPPAILEKMNQSVKAVPKSYSSNNVVWLDPESVQADVHKIVRHAKRAPEKAANFYKELNRIRRAALSYGFYDILLGLASILEREQRVMRLDTSKHINPETFIHMEHVISCLRTKLDERSFDTDIMPPVIPAAAGATPTD